MGIRPNREPPQESVQVPYWIEVLKNTSLFGDCNNLEPQGQPFINGCFNWMIPNLYIGNGCFTKHLFINGCFGVPGSHYILSDHH